MEECFHKRRKKENDYHRTREEEIQKACSREAEPGEAIHWRGSSLAALGHSMLCSCRISAFT